MIYYIVILCLYMFIFIYSNIYIYIQCIYSMSSIAGSCGAPPERWWPINLAHMALPAASGWKMKSQTQRPSKTQIQIGVKTWLNFWSWTIRLEKQLVSQSFLRKSWGLSHACSLPRLTTQDYNNSRCLHPMSVRFAISSRWMPVAFSWLFEYIVRHMGLVVFFFKDTGKSASATFPKTCSTVGSM